MKKVTTRIGDFIKIYKGKKAVLVSDSQKDDYQRFIQIDDLRNNNKLKFTNSKGVSVNPNDIIIAWDGANAGTIGHGLSGIIGSTLAKIEIQKNNIIPQYLGWFLKGKFRYLRDRCTGTTIPHISREVLTNILIPLPSIEDQKRIVKILDAADALRQKRKQAITLLDDYLQSVFLDMFGDPIKNPKGWKTSNIKNLTKSIVAGWSANGEDRQKLQDEYGVLKISSVTYGFFKSEEYKALKIVATKGKKLIHPKRGDILFSRANTRELVGASCVVMEDYPDLFLPDKLWKIVVDESKVNPIFFQKNISNIRCRNELAKKATGTSGSMLNISMDKFKNELAILPPLEIQNKFAELVKKTEVIKRAMIAQFEVLETQFQALMQKAFKGEL